MNGELLDDHRGVDRVLFEARRHLRWARTGGVGRLIEEDQLNVFDRAPAAARRVWWRVTHGGVQGTAMPVFLAGVQRSGTNMVVRGFERSPEFEVHNENDWRAFRRYSLRPDPVIRGIVERSRARFVLFKPLCDSHRVDDLLDHLGTPVAPRAIWAYRSVDGRVRSSLAKFGPHNLRVLSDIAKGVGLDRWQAQRIAPDTMALVRAIDWTAASPATAAALFWYVRNRLYFDQGLDARGDVALVSYERLVARPRQTLEPVANLLGVHWDPAFVAHIDTRSLDRSPQAALDLDPRVRAVCDDLQSRLDHLAADRETPPPGADDADAVALVVGGAR